jgi:hypothetical protein
MRDAQLLVRLSFVPALVVALFLSQRGRAAAPVGQFVVDGDVVEDTRTGLVWQNAVAVKNVSFAGAQSYCENLTLGGSSAWRTPSLKELQTLVDDEYLEGPTMHEQEAFDPMGDVVFVWSSTAHAGRPGEAWAVNFTGGLPTQSFATDLMAVRCVR